ncbi:MAG: hypothetical protein ABI723_05580 [Bacteroidia bacterium]
MKNLISLLIILCCFLFIASCLNDKGEIAQPNNGCDTTYYTLQIKPIIDNNCAISGCHITGGAGTGNFTTYSGIKPYLQSGSVNIRINLPANDPLYMPQGSTLDPVDLTKLNDWIASGFQGCD